MILGLTGGIGSGKTTASKIFHKMGIEVVDADKVAREIMDHLEVKKEIEKNFGKEVLLDNGEIDRFLLKNKVFKDDLLREKLNSIIHPKVEEVFKSIYNRAKASQEKDSDLKIIVFDIPLLFETGLDKYCDKVLVVYIEENLQLDRIMTRDGITQELGKSIIKSQMSVEEKIKKADYIIENNQSIDNLEKKLQEVIIKINTSRGE